MASLSRLPGDPLSAPIGSVCAMQTQSRETPNVSSWKGRRASRPHNRSRLKPTTPNTARSRKRGCRRIAKNARDQGLWSPRRFNQIHSPGVRANFGSRWRGVAARAFWVNVSSRDRTIGEVSNKRDRITDLNRANNAGQVETAESE